MRGFHELQHLVINHLGGAIGVLTRLQTVHHGGLVIVVAPLDGTELVGEPVFDHHGAGDVRGLLDIVRGTGGWIVEHDLLSSTAAHSVGHLVEQLVARLRVAVGSGHHGGVAECTAARQNRHLGHRIGVVQGGGHQSMATLVVCGVAQLFQGHALGLALRTGLDTINGLVNGTVVDELGTGAGAQQGSFVEHIGQVGTSEARGTHGDHVQVDIRHERLALGMHLQDRLTAFQIGCGHAYLTVESTRAQQGGVKHVGTVGRGDDDEVSVVVETIHLHEQLIQRLLTFVMATTHAGATLATHGIDFVDEDNGGSVLLGLVKQVTHAGGTESDEHLDEVGTGHRVERHAGLACDGSGQQRLTGSRRAIQQHAARNASAQCLVLGRILEEVLDFLHLGHGLVLAGHIGELGGGGLTFEQLAAVLLAAHAEHATGTAHATHQEPEQGEEDDERQNRGDEVAHHAGLLDVGGPALGQITVLHGLGHLSALRKGVVELNVLAVVGHLAGVRILLGIVVLELKTDYLLVIRDFGVGGFTLVQQRKAVFGVDGFGAAASKHLEHQHDHNHQYRAPQPRRLPDRLVLIAVLTAIVVVAAVERVVEWVAVVAVIVRVRVIPVARTGPLGETHACTPW